VSGSIARLVSDYSELRRILAPGDFAALLAATMKHAPSIIRTGTLTSVDLAMSRNLRIRYRGTEIEFPLADIDRLLAGNDNPTFGNIREIFCEDCYLRRFRLAGASGPVLDLGANRGMFSILALTVLKAGRVIGVEPQKKYESVMKMLLDVNGVGADRQCRYTRFIASPSTESQDPTRNVSVATIHREQGLDRILLVKIDIEGAEKELFAQPDWLDNVDNVTMEVHPQWAGDLSQIPAALKKFGFQHLSVDQAGTPRDIQHAAYVYASRTGALIC